MRLVFLFIYLLLLFLTLQPLAGQVPFVCRGDYFISLALDRRIFSRWGGLLYEARELTTNEAGKGWDGTVSGRPVSTGVYLYYVRIRFPDGAVEEKAIRR